MKNEQDKRAIRIGVGVGVGMLLTYFLIIFSIFALVFRACKGDDYTLADYNDTVPEVEEYLNGYLKWKYEEDDYTLSYITREKTDFCGTLFGCLGVGDVGEIYTYYFDATNEEGTTRRLSYTNAYREDKVLYKERVYDDFSLYNVEGYIDNRIKELYPYNTIDQNYTMDRFNYIVFDEEFDIDKFDKELPSYNSLIGYSMITNNNEAFDSISATLNSYYNFEEVSIDELITGKLEFTLKSAFNQESGLEELELLEDNTYILVKYNGNYSLYEK